MLKEERSLLPPCSLELLPTQCQDQPETSQTGGLFTSALGVYKLLCARNLMETAIIPKFGRENKAGRPARIPTMVSITHFTESGDPLDLQPRLELILTLKTTRTTRPHFRGMLL